MVMRLSSDGRGGTLGTIDGRSCPWASFCPLMAPINELGRASACGLEANIKRAKPARTAATTDAAVCQKRKTGEGGRLSIKSDLRLVNLSAVHLIPKICENDCGRSKIYKRIYCEKEIAVVLLFLDTANLDEIKEIAAWGVLDGVTTNPTLVGKEGKEFKRLVREICKVVPGPVSAEVVATDSEGMVREGRDIATWAENIVVKCPLTPAGLAATSILHRDGIKVNVTLCFSVNQAILAARAGAYFVSPFVGRLEDINEDGIGLVEQIVEVFHIHGFDTRVLSASIRTPMHVTRSALAGAHICTMPYKVFKQLVSHPLTDKGLEGFLADWKRAEKAMSSPAKG